MLYLYSAVIITYFWLYWLWKRRKFYALLWKISGPLGYPLIGMAHKLARRDEILQIIEEYIKKYGSLFYSWLGPYPFVVVSDPVIAQDILTSMSCINKGVVYEVVDYSLGKGLFSLNDVEWSRHRKFMNTAFKHQVLLNFIPTFNKENEVLLENLRHYINQGPIDLLPILQKFTLTLTTKTTMGNTALENDGQITESLLQSYPCMLKSTTEILFSPWLRYPLIRRLWRQNQYFEKARHTIKEFIRNLIIMKLRPTNESNCDNNVFINVALDLWKRHQFTQTNVEDECNVIVFGALETTTNTIAYTLILLSMFPQYQQKLYDELVSVFPERGNFDVSWNNIQSLPYLDMILNETMRVLTPVPLVSRQTTKDVQLSNGIVLPKGIQIAINIFHIHRRTDIWGSESHIFNPDNFLPSNMEGKHAYAFMPFTKGIRNCIGWRYGLLSAKISLVKLLRNFKFTTDFQYENLAFVEDVTLKLKQVPKLSVYNRDN